jgi:hypothetical protein
MFFQSRLLATALSSAPQFLLGRHMPQYYLIFVPVATSVEDISA